MEEILHRASEIAVEAARFAGTLIRERFGGSFRVREKGDFGDLVTEVDEQAEQEIIRRIRRHFPDHAIRGEETGQSGDVGDWLWMVDPLDGTNNFAIGLPLCAVSVTLLYRDVPVLGVICDAHLDQVYVARRGKGAFCGEQRLQAGVGGKDPKKMTLGWIQGHQVQKDPVAAKLRERLDQGVKRVLRLWAPSLLWCMLARGDLDGIVLYDSEGEDLYAGLLLAQEAGVLTMDFDGRPFEGKPPTPYILACRREDRETLCRLIL
jgi:myo-inositol-1(or 4)-monophosphatase